MAVESRHILLEGKAVKIEYIQFGEVTFNSQYAIFSFLENNFVHKNNLL